MTTTTLPNYDEYKETTRIITGRDKVPDREIMQRRAGSFRGTYYRDGLNYQAILTRNGWLLTGDYHY